MTVSTQAQILPPELERYIFEIAAYQSLPTAAKLTLVARRVRLWYVRLFSVVLTVSDIQKIMTGLHCSGSNLFFTAFLFSLMPSNPTHRSTSKPEANIAP
jgi:hypothetical protein